MTEIGAAAQIVEFGCGNGRDSEFFNLYGANVVAFDSSESAIDFCRSRSRFHQPGVRYECRDVMSLQSGFSEFLPDGGCLSSIFVYARFFLHALTEVEEIAFFNVLSKELSSGSKVFLEYRTRADMSDYKVYGEHYRRYVDHGNLLKDMERHGLSIEYEVEGRGLAKYKDEDAIVGRCIAKVG